MSSPVAIGYSDYLMAALSAQERGELDPRLGLVVASGGNAGLGNAYAAAPMPPLDGAFRDERSPLYGASPASVTVENGRLTSSERPDEGDTYRGLLARNHLSDAEAIGT
jgi:hypothetical protein